MLAIHAGMRYCLHAEGSPMENSIGKQSEHAQRASKGGAARMNKLSRAERQLLASQAAKARWQRVKAKGVTAIAGSAEPRADTLPEARLPGVLNLAGVDIPVYVLSNGQRVIARIA